MKNDRSATYRYPAYKDSGIEELGAIPKHWRVSRIKDELSSLDYKRIPLSGEVRGEMTNPIYDYYGASGIIDKVDDYIFDKSLILIGEDGANLLNRGSALAFIARGKYWVNNHAHILEPKKGDLDFFCYLLESFDYTKLVSGSAQPKLTAGALNNVVLMCPPLPEQKSIAHYLDTKTTQIDRKIDLLTQKATQYGNLKQSLINETVTRGLDRSVEMKDSGIEWIGEVPEHWGITAVTSVTTPVSIKNHPNEELLSVYRDYGVIVKSTRDDNHNRASENLASYKLVEPNYLVINKMKAWQGSLGISEFRGIVSPAYITCKTDKKVISRDYLHHLLRCRTYINEYNRLSYGVRNDQWDMRYDDFKYVPVLLPPVFEQKVIADYLDTQTTQIDQIIQTLNTQIGKLKELRKTLINDVVTGKIRVIEDDPSSHS
jgi:type I restriction enzyme, S subunit